MAKMKFRVKKRTKKNNINVDVDNNNIEKYDKDIAQEDRTIEDSLDDLNLEQNTTEETPKGRKKKRKMKMRFRNPLVKLMKKL